MQWKHSVLSYFLAAGLFFSMVGMCFSWVVWDSTTVLISSIAFALAFLGSLIFYSKKHLNAEEKYIVLFDEDSVEARHPERPDELIRWKELSDITIITTDKGPYEPYIWICLRDTKGHTLTFPLGAKNSRSLIEKILGFEGMNLSLWAKAMASVQNDRFIVWKKLILKGKT